MTQQVRPSAEIGPAFVLTLQQVSQAWCRMALEATPNTALFPSGGDLSADEDDVRDTIRRWHLHFWGIVAQTDDINNVYGAVYEPLASVDPIIGYTGMCSYFVRHPNWMFY